MEAHLYPVLALAPVVVLLILAEFRQERRRVYLLKPLATCLVILVAALSWLTPAADSTYTGWLLVGLSLSMAGDIALMFPQPRAFVVGLAAFLLAHVVYGFLFGAYAGLTAADLFTGGILLVIGVIVYRYLSPGLGRLKIPVATYMIVICLMLQRALAAFFGGRLTTSQAWLIGLGAFLFWVSDLILGINRFRRPFEYHRISLAFYYAGQLLIALSASYFG